MSEIYVSANPLTIFFFLVLDTLRHSLAYKRCIAMWGDAFIEHGVIGKIFVAKKYFITPLVFKVQMAEMVLTSKLGRIQPEIQI